ncbi:hypothetical protein [Pelagicoccus mobilis]|uniref:Cupin domain-containing protein n=1 Tax=Pelagicoccus mobilis TaxID=415221 RepID=A0A934S2A0_9BACT|nr:hypothetical protein [Pelagicoccus mobilis]MBK1879870.1 hypothetical protein [Pelagicoccus mobilis]
MRINKSDVPVKIDVPGAVARQALEFGDATGYSKMAGEYFSMGAGTDISGLLKGLEGDMCQSPHWGYMIEGHMVISYSDGSEEYAKTGDLFYWPAGHTVRAEEDSEIILFSPQHEHCAVVDHIHAQVAG